MHTITRRQFGAIALASVLGAGAALAGCTPKAGGPSGSAGSGTVGAAKPQGSTLRVGVRGDIMGFGALNEDTGKYYGLEIDIARDLAGRIGYQNTEFVTVTPENRKQMLLDGDIDMLIACYSISGTRTKNFDFSPSYYDDAIIAVVENSSLFEKLDDLKGATFGAMGGANAAPLLNNKLKEIGFSEGTDKILGAGDTDVAFDTWKLKQYPSYEELSRALETGEVDAAVMDGAIAKTYMDYKRHILEGFEVAEQSYGVATQKGSELSGLVDQAIQDMLDDGTIEALVDKWD